MTGKAVILEATDPNFPMNPRKLVQFERIWTLGNTAVLREPLVGFLCSERCPGDIIVQTYDLARALRDAGIPVIGGFHSTMENEFLDLLLRGEQPVVICPARTIEGMRVGARWESALSDQRLLILSPFEPKCRRITAQLAEQRNRFVAEIAHSVLVAYAAPEGRVEQLCLKLLQNGKTVFTLENAKNERLLAAGARPLNPGIANLAECFLEKGAP